MGPLDRDTVSAHQFADHFSRSLPFEKKDIEGQGSIERFTIDQDQGP